MLGDTTCSSVFRLQVQKHVLCQAGEKGFGEGGRMEGAVLSCGPCVGTWEEALPSGISDLALPSPDSD